jgi:peptidoglycan/LPS O-acetylase OafA/YrhL
MGAMWGKNSTDPILRALRVISVISFLILVSVVVLDQGRPPDLPLTALLVGAVLLQLGYEVIVPGLSRRRNGNGEEKKTDGE